MIADGPLTDFFPFVPVRFLLLLVEEVYLV